MPRTKASPDSAPALARRRGTAETAPGDRDHAEELMELAVDAARSRHLPEFLGRFADRAARMLSAEWCGVMVFRGRETDFYQTPQSKFGAEAVLRTSLIRQGRESRQEIEIRPLAADGFASGESATPKTVAIFVPITASDAEDLGSLCLVRKRKTLDDAERRLLHALASHAALSLENFRRFSQLERSKRQWVEDIDAISDFIVVHDRSWRVLRTNRSLASHLGVPPVALVGEAMSRLRQIAESGSDLPCPFCRDTQQTREEYVVASPERIFLVSTSRAPGLSDDDTRTIHVLKDITDRREAERRYRELFDSIQEGLFFATPEGRFLDVNDAMVRMLGYDSREELQRERDFNQKILNTTQSMILVLDTAGLISYANRRCFESGYREDELIGHRLVDWVEAAHRDDFDAALETTAHGQQVENLELRVRRSDASMGHFSISLSPMRDEQNAVNSVVVVMTDITDAALLQAKLAHSEKMATIGRLVSGVAHEVNNPLAAILGFTDLLLENPEVPVSAREDLQIILQETQRTKDIVQDLLSFARQRPVQRELVQVNSVLRQTIKLRSYDFASHGVEVVEDFEETLAAALGDSQQLQQVFLNILNNAYDAVQEAGQRGRIRIHTRRQAEMIEVAISDNGTGIIDAQRIFDPFYTTKQVGKGTGLGLSICYGIVRAHGGEIQCWNNEAGLGSTFVVRIPVATEAAMSAAAAKEAGR